ncbi:MAG: hypothetical protein QM398_04385 [Thermoproteota archaeon]|nr:hypothetical protein [Thermoproteota archaeon]
MSLRLTGAFLDVKTCSKAVLALCRGYGKSPCFLEVAFLRLLGVDCRVLKVACVDGAKTLECAF